METRQATLEDVAGIAAVHAESWRRHYRGAYRDDFLDGPVLEDRSRVWAERLSRPPLNQFVVLAEEERKLVGFACAFGADDDRWGTLLDNIHVDPAQQRRGIGSLLLSEVVRWCRGHHADCGLYLWVLAQNRGAQQFYARLGAVDCGGEVSEPPGGGEIHGRRYVWHALADFGVAGSPSVVE